MASLSSHASPSESQDPAPQNSPSNYWVYFSFCSKNPTPSRTLSPNWIERYDPSTNSWELVTLIPELNENNQLKGFTMVTLDDSIYIIGGWLCHKTMSQDSDNIDEDDLNIVSRVSRYCVRTDTWNECAPLSFPRFDFACTVSDGKIYVAGGQTELASACGISSVEVYDPALDEWKSLPDMNKLRLKCVGLTWHGKVHVVGGFTQGGEADHSPPFIMGSSSFAEVYDSEHAKWDLVGMWQLDVPPNQIVAVDDRLFSSGDCLNKWKGHIEAYDSKLNIWSIVDKSHLQNLSSPTSASDGSDANWPPIERLYLTMAPIGTQLYFFVGYRTAGELPKLMSAVHVFDTSATEDGWRSYEPVQEDFEKELCSHCCVVKCSRVITSE